MSILSIQTKYDVIIIGGGAAGLFCAGQAGLRGKKVLLLEHNAKVGAKILISGGGRCNFTNLKVSAENFVSQNPHFARSALSQYPTSEFIKLVESYGIPYIEKTLGQLFVDQIGGAKLILDMLLDICAKGKVNIRTETEVIAIRQNDGFEVDAGNLTYHAPKLVVATGGKSIPKMGATGFAYEVAKQFNVPVTATSAGLVPFIFTGSKYDWMKSLAGTAVDVVVSYKNRAFHEALLFTHKGLSGPAILQISNYYEPGQEIIIDFGAGKNFEEDLLKTKAMRPHQLLSAALARILPQKLAKILATLHNLDSPLQAIKNAELIKFAKLLNNYAITPAGDEGYFKAEVTKGGIDTNALNQKTLECKAVNGLYFIGEAVDVTGWLGGYNFAWAWASGYSCAQAV